MQGGFRSPAPWWGISDGEIEAGFTSPAPWLGVSDGEIERGYYTLPWFQAGVVGAVVPPAGDCLPWIGSAWIADCPEQHYTLGWICCDAAIVIPVPGPQPGGGEGRRHYPSQHPNKRIAMREDEELLVMLEAYFNRHRLH